MRITSCIGGMICIAALFATACDRGVASRLVRDRSDSRASHTSQRLTSSGPNSIADTASTDSVSTSALAYAGHDVHGIPRYTQRVFTHSERTILRQVYGIENPNRLYVSDSTPEGLLKYDTQLKRCARCYVNSYRVGFISIRRAGESWDQLDNRVRHMTRHQFSRSAQVSTVSTAALDPTIRSDVESMLADARRRGFMVSVLATYRTSEREAYLMAMGGKRTHTLTSLHSYGRAIDVAIGDGNPSHPQTRATWIAFRKWVSSYNGGEFRIIGSTDRTWDWPHLEIPSKYVGFRSIDAAIARGRHCIARQADPVTSETVARSCDFEPHLPDKRR